MSGVIRKEVSFIAQKDLTLSSKLSELYGSWLVKFKTPQTKDMIVLQISTFEGKLFSMNARGQRYPHFEHPGQISKYFSLIEKNNEIFYTTAQSRIQIMRAQSTNILRYRTVIWTVILYCESWLHLPSLVPYLTTVPLLLVHSLQLLKYQQRFLRSVAAL